MRRALRDFLAGWRLVTISPDDRTAAFDALFCAGIGLRRERRARAGVMFRVREGDVPRLGEVLDERGIFHTLSGRRGIPAVIAFCFRRPAVPLGFFLLALWIAYSSRLVWDIRVEGNTKTPTAAILETLDSLGFSVGTDWKAVDFDQLHADYVAAQNDIAWLSVYMDGTVARVQVRELWADGVRADHTATGANIVADCTGVIEEVNVFEGTAAVRAGDVVRPGQVAISGVIEKKDGGFRWEYAAGEVWASVAVPLSVEIPLETVEIRATGREKVLRTLKIFKKSINLSLNYGITYASYDKIDTIGQLCFPDGTPLPVLLETAAVRETEAIPVTLSADDAAARAKTEMRALIRETTDGAQLLGKSVRGALSPDGSVYRLDALLTVRRDIGRIAEFPVRSPAWEGSP